MPYLGWRHKPINPPENLNEFVEQVGKINMLMLPLYVFSILNFLIKTIEQKKEVKIIKLGKVSLKSRLLFKWKLIIFQPFMVVLYKRPLQYQDLVEGDNVRMELTFFGRLLNYEIANNYNAKQH